MTFEKELARISTTFILLTRGWGLVGPIALCREPRLLKSGYCNVFELAPERSAEPKSSRLERVFPPIPESTLFDVCRVDIVDVNRSGTAEHLPSSSFQKTKAFLLSQMEIKREETLRWMI